MEHIRLGNPETTEELHAIQRDLIEADPTDPRFLDAIPGSLADVTERMRQKCGGTLPENLHIIEVTSVSDLITQFADIAKERQRREATGR